MQPARVSGLRSWSRPWLVASAGAGAAVTLWASTGWSWIAAATALAVAVVVRVATSFLPAAVRQRSGLVAGASALVALATQSSVWAVVLVIGLGTAGSAALVGTSRARPVAALGTVVAVVGVAGLVVTQVIADASAAADREQLSAWNRAQLLPRSPEQALRELVRLTADNDDTRACAMFTDAGAAAFAATSGSPDCATAVHRLHDTVTDPALFREIARGAITTHTADSASGRTSVDGCHLQWSATPMSDLLYGSSSTARPPGPQIGTVIVEPSGYGVGWRIADIRRC